jgi:hypothetical protein
MTEKEAMEFLDAAFIAFPGVHQWLKNASPSFEASKAVWARSLMKISLDEGFGVLSRWTSGALKAPEGYQKETFHLHVVQTVMQDRTEAKRHEVREEYQKTHSKGSVLRGDPIMGPFICDVMNVHEKWCKGLISESERDRQVMQLERDALAKVGYKLSA